MFNIHKKSGQSGMEFVALVSFVMVAAFIFYPHIRNHMAGRWHLVGDSLSYGMAYQEGTGKNCSYDSQFNIWYDNDCFQNNDCDSACYSSIPPPGGSGDPCQPCLQGCSSSC